MEGMMHERIGKLVERLQGYIESGQPVTLDSAFSAMTADIIIRRFFGEHFDYLDMPDFKQPVEGAFFGVSLIFHVARFIPGLAYTLIKMPIPIIRMILPPVADVLVLQRVIKPKILASFEDASKEEEESKAIDRLIDEGTTIIVAGTVTSARALSVGMFHLLNDKTKLQKLRDELKQLPFKPDNDYSMAQLEPLPYLTPLSQSTYFVHTDPDIYPDPWTFDPERWIEGCE
ncbi:Trichodiene oxygenase-like protein [Hapsidospora chrysogenum ATCC 11550]|uniref:Trichodiene oxygenase-like protein n=1 Tax=Hapsidospora chrysogenum (strain ATCC 11550 / CBS 779.69 / DSM 880 / IAM 14645 / JCM 23072 / IMI 49137) TaxID=857340 RepID=A0A086T6Y5_HAPC1|nr:Trichodiene oxygenase-like protein [Hapsidospora chrysogenum ATCC 11550]